MNVYFIKITWGYLWLVNPLCGVGLEIHLWISTVDVLRNDFLVVYMVHGTLFWRPRDVSGLE